MKTIRHTFIKHPGAFEGATSTTILIQHGHKFKLTYRNSNGSSPMKISILTFDGTWTTVADRHEIGFGPAATYVSKEKELRADEHRFRLMCEAFIDQVYGPSGPAADEPAEELIDCLTWATDFADEMLHTKGNTRFSCNPTFRSWVLRCRTCLEIFRGEE